MDRAAELIHKGCLAEARSLLSSLDADVLPWVHHARGWVAEHGSGELFDLDRAAFHYMAAAEAGHADSYYALGCLLADRDEFSCAREAFHTGVAANHDGCRTELARLLVHGQGGESDLVRARELLHAAAENGYLFANRLLLGIEWRKNRSVVKRLLILGQLLRLLPKVLSRTKTGFQ
ncbi:MAG: sel1 repeat family protein [Sphingomonas sp.]|nr:sel1 repeat family protein [Sphingomonas sp.]